MVSLFCGSWCLNNSLQHHAHALVCYWLYKIQKFKGGGSYLEFKLIFLINFLQTFKSIHSNLLIKIKSIFVNKYHPERDQFLNEIFMNVSMK